MELRHAMLTLRHEAERARRNQRDSWETYAQVRDGEAVFGSVGRDRMAMGDWVDAKDDGYVTESRLIRYEEQLRAWKAAGVYDVGTDLVQVR